MVVILLGMEKVIIKFGSRRKLESDFQFRTQNKI